VPRHLQQRLERHTPKASKRPKSTQAICEMIQKVILGTLQTRVCELKELLVFVNQLLHKLDICARESVLQAFAQQRPVRKP
jgi:hypothetical protein